MSRSARSCTALFVAAIYLTGNVVLGSATESNLWTERRSHRSVQVASLPAPLPAAVTPSLPAIRSTLGAETPVRRPHTDRLSGLFEALSGPAAQVREVHDAGAGAPVVVLMQDVHLHPEAQHNVAAALEAVLARGGLSAVVVEGTTATFDFSRFREFPAAVRVPLSEAYLERNLISAPSFVGLTADAPPPIVGAEKGDRYDANVRAYLASRALRPRRGDDLILADRALAEKERAVYPPPMAVFVASYGQHHLGKLAIGDYVRRLRAWNPDLPPVLARFAEAYDLERALDFARVERERRMVVEKLAHGLGDADLKTLMDGALALKDGGDVARFYRVLGDACRRGGVRLADTPAFDAYVRYVLLSDGIDATALFAELSAVEEQVGQALAGADDARALFAERRQILLATKLLDFGLTPDEWDAYRRGAPLAGIDLKDFEAFYEIAHARTADMADRALANAAKGPVALISGGFHTPGLAAALRSRGASYLVVTPRITKILDETGTGYLSVFAREKTPLDRLFEGEQLFLNPNITLLGTASARGAANRWLVEAAAFARRLAPSYRDARLTVSAITGALARVSNGRTAVIVNTAAPMGDAIVSADRSVVAVGMEMASTLLETKGLSLAIGLSLATGFLVGAPAVLAVALLFALGHPDLYRARTYAPVQLTAGGNIRPTAFLGVLLQRMAAGVLFLALLNLPGGFFVSWGVHFGLNLLIREGRARGWPGFSFLRTFRMTVSVPGKDGGQWRSAGRADAAGETDAWFVVSPSNEVWVFKAGTEQATPFAALAASAYAKVAALFRPAAAVRVASMEGKTGRLERVLFRDGAPPAAFAGMSDADLRAYVEANRLPGLRQSVSGVTALTDAQMADILQEMVIGWLFSNHAMTDENYVVDKSGRVIGVNHEQAFRNFPGDRLDIAYNPDGGRTPLHYLVLARLALEGKLSLSLIEGTLAKLEKLDDAKLAAFIRPLAVQISAARPAEFPTPEAFIDRFLARKQSLRADFQTFFNGIKEKMTPGNTDFSAFFVAAGGNKGAPGLKEIIAGLQEVQKPDFAALTADLGKLAEVLKVFKPADLLANAVLPPMKLPTLEVPQINVGPAAFAQNPSLNPGAVTPANFNAQVEDNRGLAADYGIDKALLDRIAAAQGDATKIIALIDERFDQLKARAPPWERAALQDQRNRIVQRLTSPGPAEKKLKVLLRLLGAWVAKVRNSKPGFHRMHLARDGGFFHAMDQALTDLTGDDQGGSSVYMLSRARMGWNETYNPMKQIINAAKNVAGGDVRKLQSEVRLRFQARYQSDPVFAGYVDAIWKELQALGYGDMDRLLITDTGFLGTIPFFIKNVIDLKSGKPLQVGGEDRVQIAIVDPSAVGFAAEFLGFSPENLPSRDRDVVGKLAEDNPDLGMEMENLEIHPIGYDASINRFERTNAATQLEFFFQQVVAGQMALAFHAGVEGVHDANAASGYLLSLKSDIAALAGFDAGKPGSAVPATFVADVLNAKKFDYKVFGADKPKFSIPEIEPFEKTLFSFDVPKLELKALNLDLSFFTHFLAAQTLRGWMQRLVAGVLLTVPVFALLNVNALVLLLPALLFTAVGVLSLPIARALDLSILRADGKITVGFRLLGTTFTVERALRPAGLVLTALDQALSPLSTAVGWVMNGVASVGRAVLAKRSVVATGAELGVTLLETKGLSLAVGVLASSGVLFGAPALALVAVLFSLAHPDLYRASAYRTVDLTATGRIRASAFAGVFLQRMAGGLLFTALLNLPGGFFVSWAAHFGLNLLIRAGQARGWRGFGGLRRFNLTSGKSAEAIRAAAKSDDGWRKDATTLDAGLRTLGLADYRTRGTVSTANGLEIYTVRATSDDDLAFARNELAPTGTEFRVVVRDGRVIGVVPSLPDDLVQAFDALKALRAEKNPNPRPSADADPEARARMNALVFAWSREQGARIAAATRALNDRSASYIFLGGLDAPLAESGSPDAAADWTAHLDRQREDLEALEGYVRNMDGRPEAASLLRATDGGRLADVWVEISPEKRTMRPATLRSALTDERAELPAAEADGTARVLLRLLPTVYSPADGVNFLADQDYYGQILSAPESYERGGRTWTGKKKILLVGAGSGTDTLSLVLAAIHQAGLRDPARGRPYTLADLRDYIARNGRAPEWAPAITARDVNPLAIATTQDLFRRAGIGDVLSVDVGLNVPEAASPEDRFDVVVWNMPAYPATENVAPMANALTAFHDHGENGKRALDELAARLPRVLADGGFAVFWNYVRERDVDGEGRVVPDGQGERRDIVEHRLATDPEARARGFSVERREPNAWGSAVYLVSAPAKAPAQGASAAAATASAGTTGAPVDNRAAHVEVTMGPDTLDFIVETDLVTQLRQAGMTPKEFIDYVTAEIGNDPVFAELKDHVASFRRIGDRRYPLTLYGVSAASDIDLSALPPKIARAELFHSVMNSVRYRTRPIDGYFGTRSRVPSVNWIRYLRQTITDDERFEALKATLVNQAYFIDDVTKFILSVPLTPERLPQFNAFVAANEARFNVWARQNAYEILYYGRMMINDADVDAGLKARLDEQMRLASEISALRAAATEVGIPFAEKAQRYQKWLDVDPWDKSALSSKAFYDGLAAEEAAAAARRADAVRQAARKAADPVSEILASAESAVRGRQAELAVALLTLAAGKPVTLSEANAALALLPLTGRADPEAAALHGTLTLLYRRALIESVVQGAGLTPKQAGAMSEVLRDDFTSGADARRAGARARPELARVTNARLDEVEDAFQAERERSRIEAVALRRAARGAAAGVALPAFETAADALRANAGRSDEEKLSVLRGYLEDRYGVALEIPFAEDTSFAEKGRGFDDDVATEYSRADLPEILARLVELDRWMAPLPQESTLRSISFRNFVIYKSVRAFYSDGADKIVLGLGSPDAQRTLYHELGHSLHGPNGGFAYYVSPQRLTGLILKHADALAADAAPLVALARSGGINESNRSRVTWEVFQALFGIGLKRWLAFNARIGVTDLNAPFKPERTAEAIRTEYADLGVATRWADAGPSLSVSYIFEQPFLDAHGSPLTRNAPIELIAEYTQLFISHPAAMARVDPIGNDLMQAMLGDLPADRSALAAPAASAAGPMSLVDPLLRAAVKAVAESGFARLARALNAARIGFNVAVAPGLETYAFLFLSSALGLSGLLVIGVGGFLLAHVAVDVAVARARGDATFRDALMSSARRWLSLGNISWAGAFALPFALPFLGVALSPIAVALPAAVLLHTARNVIAAVRDAQANRAAVRYSGVLRGNGTRDAKARALLDLLARSPLRLDIGRLSPSGRPTAAHAAALSDRFGTALLLSSDRLTDAERRRTYREFTRTLRAAMLPGERDDMFAGRLADLSKTGEVGESDISFHYVTETDPERALISARRALRKAVAAGLDPARAGFVVENAAVAARLAAEGLGGVTFVRSEVGTLSQLTAAGVARGMFTAADAKSLTFRIFIPRGLNLAGFVDGPVDPVRYRFYALISDALNSVAVEVDALRLGDIDRIARTVMIQA